MECALRDAQDGGQEGAADQAFDYEFAELVLLSVLVTAFNRKDMGLKKGNKGGMYISYSAIHRLVQQCEEE